MQPVEGPHAAGRRREDVGAQAHLWRPSAWAGDHDRQIVRFFLSVPSPLEGEG